MKDSIKTTTLIIQNPQLTREELQSKIGAPPNEKQDVYTIKFDKVTLTNRCPEKLVDNIQASIRSEHVHRWKFERKGGRLYKPPLKSLAKKFGLIEITIDSSPIPKWVKLSSKVKEYRDHDAKINFFAKHLKDTAKTVTFPSSCLESATCPVPNKSTFFNSLGVKEV